MVITILLIFGMFGMVESFVGVKCDMGEPPAGYRWDLEKCLTHVNLSPSTYCYIPIMEQCLEPCLGRCLDSQSQMGLCTIQFECVWSLVAISTTTPKSTSSTTPKNNANSRGMSIEIIIVIVVISIVVFCSMCLIFGFLIYRKFIQAVNPPHQNLNNNVYVDREISFNFNRNREFIAMDQLDGNSNPEMELNGNPNPA